MYDLAISEYGDLVIGGNRDLAGVAGTDLIEQRIRLRLRLRRGEWLYDDSKTLGSLLFQLSGMTADQVHTSIPVFVREALRPMADEISIDDVLHEHDDHDEHTHEAASRSVSVRVFYSIASDAEPGTETVSEQRSVSVNIPLGAGGV